jgi:hypothetical protein
LGLCNGAKANLRSHQIGMFCSQISERLVVAEDAALVGGAEMRSNNNKRLLNNNRDNNNTHFTGAGFGWECITSSGIWRESNEAGC